MNTSLLIRGLGRRATKALSSRATVLGVLLMTAALLVALGTAVSPAGAQAPGAATYPVNGGSGAAARASPIAPAAGPALQLNYTRAVLPEGRLGEAYAPVPLVLGGAGGYRFVVREGRLPAGLVIIDGFLVGKPTEAGRREFVLEVQDAGNPPQTVRQAYTVVIGQGARTRPKTTAAPAPAPTPAPQGVTPAEATATLKRSGWDRLPVYRLRQEVLDEVAPPAEEGAGEGIGAGKAAVEAALIKEVDALFVQMQAKLERLGLQLASVDNEVWEADAVPPPATAVGFKPAVTGGKPPPPAAPQAVPAQLREMLLPMVDVEYPSRELFDAALRGRQCQYFRELLKEGFRRREGNSGKTPPSVACPPPRPAAAIARGKADAPAKAAPGVMPLRDFYEALLPEDLREGLAEKSRAAPPVLLSQAADVRWANEPCDCVRHIGSKEIVYGVHPFWRSGEKGKEPQIDFSRFHRVSVLGVQMNERMEFPSSPDWPQAVSTLASRAHRHDTALDLLLLRDDWSMLATLTREQSRDLAHKAARNAFEEVDRKLQSNLPDLRPLLLPWWTDRDRVFSGITVMFSDPAPMGASASTDAQRQRFDDFFGAFIEELIEKMKRGSTDLVLNIVVPDTQIGHDGAYRWDALMDYLWKAQKASNPIIPEGSDLRKYRRAVDGEADITVRLMVPLSQPTTLSKKELRRRIDDNELVKGHDRVALLDSIVPVIFHPAGDKPVPLDADEAKQVNDDLAYYRWNFGGVAAWPLPVRGQGAGGHLLCLLESNFFEHLLRSPDCPQSDEAGDDHHALWAEIGHLSLRAQNRICAWACPNRSPLHLIWQGLTLAALVGLFLWRYYCAVRRWGPLVLIGVWVFAALSVLLAMALLTCDPDLRTLREGNAILNGLLVVIAVAGLWFSFKPRVVAP
jgi:hypothetical protein